MTASAVVALVVLIVPLVMLFKWFPSLWYIVRTIVLVMLTLVVLVGGVTILAVNVPFVGEVICWLIVFVVFLAMMFGYRPA